MGACSQPSGQLRCLVGCDALVVVQVDEGKGDRDRKRCVRTLLNGASEGEGMDLRIEHLQLRSQLGCKTFVALLGFERPFEVANLCALLQRRLHVVVRR